MEIIFQSLLVLMFSLMMIIISGSTFAATKKCSLNGEWFDASTDDWNPPHKRLHYLFDIHWLSETKFSYRDGVRHSKFQGSFDEMKENVYAISSRKIISTRTLDKNEYDSRPYTDMD